MFYGFCQYVGRQSLVNSSSKAGFVFHLKFHCLAGQPPNGRVDLIILILDLVYCLKKCILVGSGYNTQGQVSETVWRHLYYMGETPVAHKQV